MIGLAHPELERRAVLGVQLERRVAVALHAERHRRDRAVHDVVPAAVGIRVLPRDEHYHRQTEHDERLGPPAAQDEQSSRREEQPRGGEHARAAWAGERDQPPRQSHGDRLGVAVVAEEAIPERREEEAPRRVGEAEAELTVLDQALAVDGPVGLVGFLVDVGVGDVVRVVAVQQGLAAELLEDEDVVVRARRRAERETRSSRCSSTGRAPRKTSPRRRAPALFPTSRCGTR